MNCPSWLRIRRLETASDREIEGLSDVLRDCVEGGASVGFMLPLTRGKAEAFWRSASARHVASAWCWWPRSRRVPS